MLPTAPGTFTVSVSHAAGCREDLQQHQVDKGCILRIFPDKLEGRVRPPSFHLAQDRSLCRTIFMTYRLGLSSGWNGWAGKEALDPEQYPATAGCCCSSQLPQSGCGAGAHPQKFLKWRDARPGSHASCSTVCGIPVCHLPADDLPAVTSRRCRGLRDTPVRIC